MDEKAIKNIVKNKTKISVSIDGHRKPTMPSVERALMTRSFGDRAFSPKSCLKRTRLHVRKRGESVTNVTEEDMRHVIELAHKVWRSLGGFSRFRTLQ